MPTNVIMPALGVAQQTGTLLKWLKAEGQTVTKGEPLMEVETDKATVEIEAAGSGVLSNVTAKPGDQVPVGQAIALILAEGETASATAMPSPHPRIESRAGSNPLPKGEGTKAAATPVVPPRPLGEGRGEGSGGVSAHTSQVPPVAQSNPPTSPFVKGGSEGDFATRILASPKAKRIAREQGIDLKSLHGSGPEGSILTADVLLVASGQAQPLTAATIPSSQPIIPLTPMRRIVGQRMTQSKQSAPHFYISMDIDMTAVSQLRTAAKERGDEVIPSINDFILHACARALKTFPSVNSSFTEQGIKQHSDINLGVAVALDEGLVVPVIRNADQLSLNELAQQSRELADKAQNKKLFPLDYEGGTFTVSNLGMLGVDSFTAIINPPQCAILAVGRVAQRVVADDGMFAIRSMMAATLSADHRVLDGAVAARFLQQVKIYLENGRSTL